MKKFSGFILFLVFTSIKLFAVSDTTLAKEYLNISASFIGQNSDSFKYYLDLSKKAAELKDQSPKLKMELTRSEGYYYYYTKDFIRAKSFCFQLIELAQLNNNKYYLAFGFNNLAGNLFELGKVDSSSWAYEKAITIAKAANENKILSDFYQNYANNLTTRNKFEQGINYYLKAIEIREATNYTESLDHNYYLLGLALSDVEDFDRSKIYLEKAKKLATENKNWQKVISCLNIIALNQKAKNETDQVITSFSEAIDIGVKNNLKQEILPIYYNLANFLVSNERYEEARKYYEDGFKLSQELNFAQGLKFFSYGLAKFFLEIGEIKNISPYIEIIENQFNPQNTSLKEKKGYFELKANYYEALNNHKEALENHKLFKSYSDSISSNAQNEKILALERQFSEEKLLEANKVLEQDNTIKSMDLKIERNIRNTLIISLLILALIAGFILFQYKKIKRLNTLLALQKNEIQNQALEIEIQNNKLKKLNRDNELYFKALSHDIKNQLAIIYGYSEIIEDEIPKSLSKELVSTLKESTLTANELIDRVLTKPEQELNKSIEYVKLDHLIEKLIRENKPLIEKKELQLFKNYERHLTLGIDKLTLYRVLQNLMSNAIKFNSQGGEIIIEAKKEKDKTFVSIKDSGNGFTEKELAKLFINTKSNLSNKTEIESKSYGIGLTGVKEVLVKIGGDISAKNRVDKKGAEVYFWV